MGFLTSLLVLIHLVGAAVIVGTWIATFRRPTVTSWQFWASLVMLLSGVLLVGFAEMGGGSLNYVKITVKIVLSLAVFAAALIGWRKANRGEEVSTGLAHAVGGTALINMAVATLWN